MTNISKNNLITAEWLLDDLTYILKSKRYPEYLKQQYIYLYIKITIYLLKHKSKNWPPKDLEKKWIDYVMERWPKPTS